MVKLHARSNVAGVLMTMSSSLDWWKGVSTISNWEEMETTLVHLMLVLHHQSVP